MILMIKKRKRNHWLPNPPADYKLLIPLARLVHITEQDKEENGKGKWDWSFDKSFRKSL